MPPTKTISKGQKSDGKGKVGDGLGEVLSGMLAKEEPTAKRQRKLADSQSTDGSCVNRCPTADRQ